MKTNSHQIQNQTRSISMQGCSEVNFFWNLQTKRPSTWNKTGDIKVMEIGGEVKHHD